MHTALEAPPAAAEAVPGAQGVQAAAPAPANVPGGHTTHVELEVAPVASLAVPAGQGEALRELKGQKEPAGQRMGEPEEQ